jgi:hypothetical protein
MTYEQEQARHEEEMLGEDVATARRRQAEELGVPAGSGGD